MNKNTLNLLTITHDLQLAGKEPKLIVMPTTANRQRKMMLRGQRTT
jgi:hypothetical protein